MSQSLLLRLLVLPVVFLTASPRPLSAQPASLAVPEAPGQPKTVPLTGKWRWMDNQVVVIKDDFTFTAGKGRRGTWKLKEKTTRTVLLSWDDGLFVDELTMSADGKKLIGRNNKNKPIKAERIE